VIRGGGEIITAILFLAKFGGVFVDVAEVQREPLAAVDRISIKDFRQSFQQ